MRTFLPACILLMISVLISCNKTDSAKDKSNAPGTDKAVESVTVKDSLTHYSQARVDSFVMAVMKHKGSSDMVYHYLGSSEEGAPYLVIARTQPGSVERHERWDDIAIIRSGHGVLKTGYDVTGEIKVEDEKPWRNWLGGNIQDVKEKRLSPGDFLVIPAMMAHQYVPDPGDTLTYWGIKVKRIRR